MEGGANKRARVRRSDFSRMHANVLLTDTITKLRTTCVLTTPILFPSMASTFSSSSFSIRGLTSSDFTAAVLALDFVAPRNTLMVSVAVLVATMFMSLALLRAFSTATFCSAHVVSSSLVLFTFPWYLMRSFAFLARSLMAFFAPSSISTTLRTVEVMGVWGGDGKMKETEMMRRKKQRTD